MEYAIVIPLDLGFQEDIGRVYRLLGELLKLDSVSIYFSQEPFTVKTLIDEYHYVYVTLGTNTLIIPLHEGCRVEDVESVVDKCKVRYFKVYEPFRVRAFQFTNSVSVNPKLKHVLPPELESLTQHKIEDTEEYTIGYCGLSRIIIPLEDYGSTLNGINRVKTVVEDRTVRSLMPWHPISYGVKDLRLDSNIKGINVFSISRENYLCTPLFYIKTRGVQEYTIVLYSDERVLFSDSQLLSVEDSERNKLLLLLLNCIIYTCSRRVNVRIV